MTGAECSGLYATSIHTDLDSINVPEGCEIREIEKPEYAELQKTCFNVIRDGKNILIDKTKDLKETDRILGSASPNKIDLSKKGKLLKDRKMIEKTVNIHGTHYTHKERENIVKQKHDDKV